MTTPPQFTRKWMRHVLEEAERRQVKPGSRNLIKYVKGYFASSDVVGLMSWNKG